MKRIFVLVLSLVALISPMSLSAQELSKTNPAPISFTNSFSNYYTTGGVQEKLYMVTDKPFYSAGDTIYFSAFLVNSIYFNRATETKFIYVELVDATGIVVQRLRVIGNVVSRMRVMGSEGRFYNAMPLSARMTAGKYTLRAYSKWQTNFDDALLYSRVIEIGNYIDDAVHTKITYEFNYKIHIFSL